MKGVSLLLILILCSFGVSTTKPAFAASCEYTGGAATVALPGHPFAATPTTDGCWLFVSLSAGAKGDFTGLAVLQNVSGRFEVTQKFALPASASGLALTHDGKLLVVAATTSAAVFDVDRLESGAGDPLLGSVPDGDTSGAVYVAITPDDHFAFISDEGAMRITVADLRRGKAGAFGDDAVVGHIPVGYGPVGLAMTKDGKRLYATSQVAPAALGLPDRCNTGIAGDARLFPEGILTIIDVKRAATDPIHSPIASIRSGCTPVRIVLSPSESHAWVTARGQDALLDFDLRAIESPNSKPPYRQIPVGEAPVGIAIRPDGGEVWVSDSNRFTPGAVGALRRVSLPAEAQAVGPSGQFPRDLTFLADGKTLVAAVFISGQLQFVPPRSPDMTKVSAPTPTARYLRGSSPSGFASR